MEFFGAGKELRRFNQLFAEIEAVYHEMAWKLGLSDSAEQILYAICNLGVPCLLSDIVSFSGISKQTINSALRKLEQEGVLRLETIGGRKKQVFLTEKGERLVRQTAMQIIAIENEIYSGWTEEELSLYLALTQKYLSELKEKTKDLKRREEE
ncbi:MarR family winged helix-turn-helix transcriptional regulator [Anaerotignum faecicola]